MSSQHTNRGHWRGPARLAWGGCALILAFAGFEAAAAATPAVILSATGPIGNSQLGFSVSALGDFNGDGWPDFAVGAPFAGPNIYSTPGQAWIYYGGPGLSATPNLVLSGETNSDQFGYCVRGIGDINGDGWPDLAVSAPMNGAGGTKAGRVYIYFGGPAADSTPDLVLTGQAANDNFGWSLAGLGNLDATGPCFAVSASQETGAENGKVYIYRGGAALDTVADYVLNGPAGSLFGWSINTAGDFDGDGWPDLIVGAILNKFAYLYRGGPAFDTTADLIFTGEDAGDRFGYSVAPAGDVNGDGYGDLIIGAMHNSAASLFGGRAYVYYGGPSPNTIADLVYTGADLRGVLGRTVAGGDLNHDGFSDLLVGAPTPDTGGFGPGKLTLYFGGDPSGPRPPHTTADVTIVGEHDSDRMGAQVVAVGDVDGDGVTEFLVGANLFTPPGGYLNGKFYLEHLTNAAPVAVADSYATDEGVTLNVSAPGVLANDSDADGDALTAVQYQAPAHGTLTLAPGGGFTFVPAPGYAGRDSFAYRAYDGAAHSSPAWARIHVVSGNVPPLALDDAAATPQDSIVHVNVLANDTDPDDAIAPASLRVTTAPHHGAAIADTLAGRVVYTPAHGFVGADTLRYTVADVRGAVSNAARVIVTVIDTTPPGAIAALTAAPAPALVMVRWSGVPGDAAFVEVWRALWRDAGHQSAYPRYGVAPGATPPARPASRAAALADPAWTLAATLPAVTLALDDTLAVRGIYAYEVFARDGAGNYGPPTAGGARATNYRLGDVATPHDGVVDAADLALLDAAYGRIEGDPLYAPELDFGPTDTYTGTGLPRPDNHVDFEDVMILALNYGPAGPGPVTGGQAMLTWRLVDAQTWALRLDAACPSLKGLRVTAPLPVGVTATVTAGGLLAGQAGPVFLRNSGPDQLDIAVALLGRDLGFAGTGDLLRVTLSGAQPLGDPTLVARATDNATLPASAQHVTGVPAVTAFGLGQNSPNPFNPATTIRFSLPAAGVARLTVLDARGRLIATLADGELAAGEHAVVWNGRDGRGATAASGVYFYRLVSGAQTETQRMTLVK